MKKLNIAVVGGGDSSEAEISINGARFIVNNIDRELYNPYLVSLSSKEWYAEVEGEKLPIDKNNFSFILNGYETTFDFAYINIHGTPGENGILQSYFELISLPYSSGGVDSSAVTFNKYYCKQIAASTKVAMAKDMLITKGEEFCRDAIAQKFGFPMFIKPNASGSSFGVTKVTKKEDITEAINHAFTESDAVLIEEAIIGREFGQGVAMLDGVLTALPLTEIKSKRDFFDYDAKYNGLSEEITPAEIETSISDEIARLAKKIYLATSCRGVVRIDFIVKEQTPYLIEINSVPGMSSASIIPQQVKAMGIEMKEFLTKTIQATLK